MRPAVGKHDDKVGRAHFMHPALAPFTFNRTGKQARNRTVLAAMTNKQSHENGDVSSEEIVWLEARAEGGFGIVFTAATHVEADGQGWQGAFSTAHDRHLPGLKRMADAVTAHGALAMAQLFHGGIRAPEALTGCVPKSASSHTVAGGITAREMTEQDILTTVKAFGEAARRCEVAGFDGVELHGAHGYLISQFLGGLSNQRKDRWGGSQTKRHSFLQAIVKEVRQSTSNEFLVGVRLSPVQASTGTVLEEALATVDACMAMELDFLHVSCWDLHERGEIEGEARTYTEWFAQRCQGHLPLITTGGIWNAEDAKIAMTQGGEMVGVARAAIAHPRWPDCLKTPDHTPKRPPFTANELLEAKLSPVFVDYMRRWDGFVED